MRILLVQNMVYMATSAGATRNNQILLEELGKRNHECCVLAPAISKQGDGPKTRAQFLDELATRGIRVTSSFEGVDVFHHKGVEVHAATNTYRLRAHLVDQIHRFEPTWTLVFNDVGDVLLQAALEATPSRVVCLVHSTRELPFGPDSMSSSPSRTVLFRHTAAIVTASHYLKGYIHQWGNLGSVVLPIELFGSGPFPRFGCFDRGFVTMINPCAAKGISIFLELARRLSNVPFAAVPTWGTTNAERVNLEQLHNVQILKPVDEIDQIFAQTRIVLVPSLLAEARGRIVIEAMLRGIPVLASDVGGIPESKLGVDYLLPVRPIERYEERFDDKMNPVPVVPEQDVDPWLKALRELLSDGARYNQLSKASRDAALAFVSNWRIDSVEDFLNHLAPRADHGAVSVGTKEQNTETNHLLGNLSPEKRALLALRIKRMGRHVTKKQRRPRSKTEIAQKAMQPHAATTSANFSEHYRCADIERFPVGERQNNGMYPTELVYSRSNRSTQILPSDVVELLYRCERFRTLYDHAQDLCRGLNQGEEQVEAIRGQLSELVKAGFLVSQRHLLDRCMHSVGTQSAPAKIASVGVATYNRLDSLKRGLTSYIENNKKYGRTNDFVIANDAQEAGIRNDHRQMLRTLKTRYGMDIFYAGLEEKVRFANRLTESGSLPSEVVNFALFDVENVGFSSGANRNALLLHTIGDPIFCPDDDTVCRSATPPKLENGLQFISGRDPAQYWFFPDRKTTLQSVTFVEEDVLSIHERFLGKDLGSTISTLGETVELDFDQINSELLRRLESSRGKVLMTFNGLVGDCAWGAPFGFWGDPMGYLLLDGQSLERLVRSEANYHSACTSRELFRIVSRPVISDDTFCQTTFVGLDNRNLLPPFFPVRRGHDKIFGITLWRCFEDGYFAHLPWALLHAPVENRRYWPGEIIRSASGFDMDKVIIECVKSFEFGPGKRDGKERLHALGKHLMELGSLPLEDFEEFVRIQAWHTNSSFISMMENHLRRRGESPDYWANDVKKYIDILRRSMTREDYWVPLDLLDGRSVDEARELAQRLVLKFGQLLHWWPEMVEVARGLRSHGQRLANPV